MNSEAKRVVGTPAIYASGWWRASRGIFSRIPDPISQPLARLGSWIFPRLFQSFFWTVLHNQRMVYPDDERNARRAAARLFYQFSVKLIDLWKLESGLMPVADQSLEWRGVENFDRISKDGRGLLLIGMHLGNWELGAALLARRGNHVWIVTAEEPDVRLTRDRELARERWGIRTLVMGQDQFGFMSVVERLRVGDSVALLIDRPPEKQSVDVWFLGHKVKASIGPAILARATGCHVLPSAIIRSESGYTIHLEQSVGYKPENLSTAQGRAEFTQDIMSKFEPWVRAYSDQWYQFQPASVGIESQPKVAIVNPSAKCEETTRS